MIYGTFFLHRAVVLSPDYLMLAFLFHVVLENKDKLAADYVNCISSELDECMRRGDGAS